MRKFYLLSTLVLTLLFGGHSYAQDFSNKGKDFWVAYGYHERMGQATPPGGSQDMILYFAAEQTANVTITIPGLGYTQSLVVPANTIVASATIPKTGAQDARLLVDGLSNKGIHITSDRAVVAYSHIYNSSVSGSSILFPTNTLGKEYYSINFTNISNQNNANCWFYVVATDTGITRVEITPMANVAGVVTTGGWIAGTTYTVNLTQGQVYNVMGQFTNAPPNPANGVDLTGSKILSVASASGGCKKIAVYSGSGRISITCSNASGSSDNYMSQAFPKAAWGKKYLTTPIVGYSVLNGNTNSASTSTFYRVCVADPTTVITLNGAPIGLPLIGGFYYQINATASPLLIEGDKPFMVAQYFPSQGSATCGTTGGDGDPEVIYLSPVEQSINKVLWNASARFQINVQKHYINVVIKNAGTALSSFRLDGVLVPAASFVPHPQDPTYSYVRLNVASVPGSPTANTGLPHIVQSDSAFNCMAYGYGGAESYGYNGGTNIRDLFQFIQIINEHGTVAFPATCRGTPFRFGMVFPYRPIKIDWIFGAVLNGMGINDTTIFNAGNPIIEDSSWVVAGRTLYRYMLPRTYYITAVGTYPIRVIATNPTPDGCGNEQTIDFDVQVFEPPVADFNFVTDGCVINPVSFTDNSNTGGRPIISRHWNFGDANTSNLPAPTHLYAAPGTYNVKYSLITDVGCIADTAIHPVTLNNPPVADFTISAPLCPNIPIQFTDVSTASGGATINQWAWNFGDGNTSTLQNPTNTYVAAGTYTVTLQVRTTTGCPSLVYSFPVVIVPDGTISLTSAPGTNNQTVCINAPITNITYNVTLSSNGGSVSGLPAGVIGSFAGGVITISGTPTVSGVFNYTVTTTGPCVNPTASGTITVTADGTVSLTSAAGTDNQTVCINTAIANITYAVGGSGTGGSVSGLPAGVTGSFAGAVITITGTPTVSGTFNYTVNTSGPCVNPSISGTITVTPDGTISLTSAPGTNNQTVCINTPIINITYAVGASGNGGSVSGLPAGVSGVYAVGVITISGTPTVSGTFNYTVNTTGPCVNPTATGTITVTQDGTVTLTSAAGTDNQAVCLNTPITAITYLIAGSGTGGSVTGLPAGVAGVFAGGIITITGIPSVSGVFNYTVNTTGPCVTPIATGIITVHPLPNSNFTFSAPSCETGTVNFTDISVPNVGSITGWAWNFGDPPSGPNNTSNLQNPSHTYATAGTYNVTLVVTTSNGCVSIEPSRPVVIYPRPRAGFIVPAVCLSDTYAQFTDTSSIAVPDAIVAWNWNFGDPGSGPLNTSIIRNPQHSYTATGSYTVRLIVTSNRGCRDTINHTLFVNGSFPVADFIVQNPATLCANDSVSIAEASTVFPGSITKVEIYWDNVGQPAVFDTDNFPASGKIYKHLYPNFQAPLTRTFTIRYRAYSGGVCVNDRLRNITVNAAPLVRFNAMPNICYDAAPYQITPAIASEIGGVPGNGVFTGTGVSLTGLFTPLVAGPGTHRILYTFTSTAGGCVDTASNTITVWDTASAQIAVQPLVCERNAISFNSTGSTIPAGNGSITGWLWNFGDPASGAANTSNLENPTHTFTGWGNYNVTLSVISSNGCRSTIRTLPVFVNPEPKPNFSTPPSSCLPNASVAFTNSSIIADGTQASFTYLWNFGDPASGINNTSTLANPSHVYTSTGPFNVNLQVTSGAGCVNNITLPLTTVNPQPLASFNTDKIDVCIGGGIQFTNTSNPLNGTITQYNWSMDDGNVRNVPAFNYTYSTVGTYNVSLFIFNSNGCRSTTATRTVFANPYPLTNAGPDKFMLEGGQVTLTPVINTSIPVTYLWTPAQYLNDPRIALTIASPPFDFTYTLTITTDKGCARSDDVFIKVLKAPAIPNIFSPNGDGYNDTWVIQYLDSYPGCTVDIFNRYGQKIFHSDGYSKPWDGTIDGKPVPIGTYYYIVNPKNGRKIMSGYVDVIR